MAWSEAARRAAAEARRRRAKGKGLFFEDKARRITDNEGKTGAFRVGFSRKQILQRIANAKAYLRRGGAKDLFKSKGAATKMLKSGRKLLYGR